MKKFLPLIILAVAAVITGLLIFFKPAPNEVSPERPIANVEVVTVQPETIQLSVRSQGTLLPKTETDLSIEVSGRIIEVAENFRAGGYFEAGDVLLRIDPADYQAAVAARAADLAGAQLALAQEQALSEQAAADWAAIGKGEPSDLTLRKPQLAQAEAIVASTEAALAQAKRDLDRTRITAPYSGRVLSKNVDFGQYIVANPANPIARIYATDTAEIRLPITEREAGFLDTKTKRQRLVRLRRTNAEDPSTWVARLARIEATIEPTSRLLYVVAEVNDPFKADPESGLPALRRGAFLDAEIEGKALQNAYSLPRYALRGSNTLYVLTTDNTLQTRTVNIVKSDAKLVIIDSGLEPGERVAVSPIAYYVENMPVSIVETL
jgi:RND family efflux transporter MFP subunit